MKKAKKNKMKRLEVPQELYDTIVERAIASKLPVKEYLRLIVMSNLPRPIEYKLSTKLAFGKYVGSTVETIIKFDPRYIKWACENIAGFTLDLDAQNMLEGVGE